MSMTKFEPYLQVTDDGRIWWPLKDAIRLGAGYRPFADDDAVLNPELRAPNQRVRVNERTLIGAFSDARLTIEKPMTFERDGCHYIDASAFLTWLSQYIAQTQSEIAFPDDLAREVRNAKALAASSRTASASKEFESLTLALEAWFDQALDALPDQLRRRVEQEFLPPWDALAPAQRRAVALQRDYQTDPTTEADRQLWWDRCRRVNAIEQQFAEWEAASAPTSSDVALKENRLKELRQELARVTLQERQPESDYYPARVTPADADEAPATPPALPVRYIAYPKAMKLLAKRLGATPEELAAWVWVGPEDGGLAAYSHANELDPPPRFCFWTGDDPDYLSPMMACWFKEDDISTFQPTDRYITGKALVERWSQQPGIQPRAFILAKIRESRLLDLHPIYGGTQSTFSKFEAFPPMESGLFVLAHVEEIEAEDFGDDEETRKHGVSPCQPVSAWQICHHFPVIHNADENEKWWKDKMADAKRYRLLDCRVGEGKKGKGSLWRPDMIAGWLVDRHDKGQEGLAAEAVCKGLKRFPGCEDIADAMFPPDEQQS